MLTKLPPWLLTALCTAAILWLTLAPHPLPDTDIPLFPGADKIVHAIMFGGLALCMLLDYLRRGRRWRRPTPGHALVCGLIASIAGLAIEFLQLWMRLGRSFEIADWGADSVGAFLFPLTATVLMRKPG